jgi:hypothetical protein
MEDKKAYLVQLDYEETEDTNLLICSGLKELATGCKEVYINFRLVFQIFFYRGLMKRKL